MKPDSLESLDDEELRSVIARSQELLKIRDEERKARALSEARALLLAVGLSLKDVAAKNKSGKNKPPAYHGGSHYQHPTNKALTWNAKGQKPGWLRELEVQGKAPVELTLETTNDNAAPVGKKAL